MSLWFGKYFSCVPRRKDKAQQPPKSKRKNLSSIEICLWRQLETNFFYNFLHFQVEFIRRWSRSSIQLSAPSPSSGTSEARRKEKKSSWTCCSHSIPNSFRTRRHSLLHRRKQRQLQSTCNEWVSKGQKVSFLAFLCNRWRWDIRKNSGVGGTLCKRLMKFPRLKPLFHNRPGGRIFCYVRWWAHELFTSLP